MSQTTKESKEQIKILIELNDELENYFTNTIIPQLFVDANLILRKFTPPAMKQFKFTPEHIGRPMQEMVDNIRFSTIIENIRDVIDTRVIFEKEIQTSDLRWFQMNIIPYLIKKENKANGVIITFIDITDRINDLKELERMNSSHETFIYSVSHDLNGPLRNIESLVKTFTESFSEENKEQMNMAGMLLDSVKSMKNVINELSEITKIEGNFHEKVEVVSFEDIIKEVSMTLGDKINESKARIKKDIRVSEIAISKKNLRSVIYNLLSNAIKYKSPDRPSEILIKTEMEKGFVVISVKDNGLGFTEEKKDLIFTQFTRLEKEVEGTGIGLYLVKRIVENLGGKILAESKVGVGSEFIVYLKNQDKA